MNDLPKKIINSLEDLNKYLYSHNYILEFSDVFFMTEQINFNNVELLKHFAANSVDYQKRKIFSIEQDNFKIIFLHHKKIKQQLWQQFHNMKKSFLFRLTDERLV